MERKVGLKIRYFAFHENKRCSVLTAKFRKSYFYTLYFFYAASD